MAKRNKKQQPDGSRGRLHSNRSGSADGDCLKNTGPHIFYDSNCSYRSDSCEPLKEAVKNEEIFLDGFGRFAYPGKRLPAEIMPELCLYCYWDAKHKQSWGLQEHRNEGIELGFLSRGKLDFCVDGKCYELDSGDLTVTRPWQLHKVGRPVVEISRMHWLIIDLGVRRPSDKWEWPDWIVFSKKDLAHLTELLSYNEQPVWKTNKKIAGCFESMARAIEGMTAEKVETRLRLLINELFLELYEMLQKNKIELDPNLANTRRSVEIFLRNLKDQISYPWTLEEMASQCRLGRSRFSQYCKEITNMTPLNYLNTCRIDKAREILLSDKSSTITEIAFQCGFESSQYFATVFKKLTSCSPREYREELASEANDKKSLKSIT